LEVIVKTIFSLCSEPNFNTSAGREQFPFLYIRNAPRHGKSLALDLIYRDHPSVKVIRVILRDGDDDELVTELQNKNLVLCIDEKYQLL
jgi:hypothetical protein